MRKNDLPIVYLESNLSEIIQQIGQGRLGLVLVLNQNNVEGIITDGDLRRTIEAQGKDTFDLTASQIMSKNPKKVLDTSSLNEVEEMFLEYKINSVVVENESGELQGVIQIYDLS
jgi:arabinose-5-phosphate isomerase